MNILFLENSASLNAGAFHSLISLINNLKKYGVNSFVAIPDTTNGGKILEDNGINYIRLKIMRYSWYMPNNASIKERIKAPFKYLYVKNNYRVLLEYAEANKIDIVHENTSVCFAGYFVAKKMQIPHIWHIREFLLEDFDTRFWFPNKTYSMMNKSSAVICISEAIAEKYKKLINNDNIHVIYNGIDIDRFYNNSHLIHLNNSSKILCVGRICDDKGQKDVIQAVTLLNNERNYNLNLYLAGSVEDEYLLNVIQPLIHKNKAEKFVHLIGQNNDMPSVYNSMDILCMSSRCEAFGRVTVEAMLAGILIIGAESGGTKEIISDNKTGYFYKPGDIANLANTIDRAIISKDSSIKIAREGQIRAKKDFDSKLNAYNIYKLYNKLLGIDKE